MTQVLRLAAPVAPHLALAGGIVALLSIGLGRTSRPGLVRATALAAFAAAFALARAAGDAGVLAADSMTRAWTLLFAAGGAALALLVRDADEVPFALAAGSALGMAVLASGQNLVAIFLGLELMSLPAYVLVFSLRRTRASLEAATKYFFMGSAASAVFLLGMAHAFGATGGSFDLPLLRGAPWGATSLALLATAALFKIGAAPLHFWLPDVYEASSPELAGFLSTSMKAAGFLLLMRLVAVAEPSGAFDALLPAFAAVTMTAGNVLAFRQASLQRLLAYSSISHAGYLLLGVSAWFRLGASAEGAAAVYFYLASYLVTNMGAFAAVAVSGLKRVDDLRGLARREPGLAAVFSIFLLSLAGIPPTAGFLSKLLVFWDAVIADQVWLVALAALNSLVGLGYYLRLVRLMVLEAPAAEGRLPDARRDWRANAVLWACAGPAIALGAGPWAADLVRRILVEWR